MKESLWIELENMPTCNYSVAGTSLPLFRRSPCFVQKQTSLLDVPKNVPFCASVIQHQAAPFPKSWRHFLHTFYFSVLTTVNWIRTRTNLLFAKSLMASQSIPALATNKILFSKSSLFSKNWRNHQNFWQIVSGNSMTQILNPDLEQT